MLVKVYIQFFNSFSLSFPSFSLFGCELSAFNTKTLIISEMYQSYSVELCFLMRRMEKLCLVKWKIVAAVYPNNENVNRKQNIIVRFAKQRIGASADLFLEKKFSKSEHSFIVWRDFNKRFIDSPSWLIHFAIHTPLMLSSDIGFDGWRFICQTTQKKNKDKDLRRRWEKSSVVSYPCSYPQIKKRERNDEKTQPTPPSVWHRNNIEERAQNKVEEKDFYVPFRCATLPCAKMIFTHMFYC